VPSALVLFGEQLRKLREARNLSQERLGELCNFNRLYIGRIERGERVISFEYMMRIAFILKSEAGRALQAAARPGSHAAKGRI
jgi:transcriptional regulator with XRE-family HTH domain